MRLPNAPCHTFWSVVISTTLLLNQVAGSAIQSDSEPDVPTSKGPRTRSDTKEIQKILVNMTEKTFTSRASVKAAALDEPKDVGSVDPSMLQSVLYDEKPEASTKATVQDRQSADDLYAGSIMIRGYFYEEEPEAPTKSRALEEPQEFDEKRYQDLRWLMLDPNSKVSWDFSPPEWDLLQEKMLKKDDYELYNASSEAIFSICISEEWLCNEIIKFDASNILSHLDPQMIQKVSEKVNSMTGNVPERILNQINPPHTIESAEALRKLFRVGYSGVSKSCLVSKNGQLSINSNCALEFADSNALSLLQEMFKGNPGLRYAHDYLCSRAIKMGSLDVAKWLNSKKTIESLSISLVSDVMKSGHWETIKWLSSEVDMTIDWPLAISLAYEDIGSHAVIRNLQSYANIELTDEIEKVLLATSGSMDGLQDGPADPESVAAWVEAATPSQRRTMVNAVAMAGRTNSLTWARGKASVFPSNEAVVEACKRGKFSTLHELFAVDSTRIESTEKVPGSTALECIVYAAMQNNQKEMNWILGNALKSVLPGLSAIYSQSPNVSDEVQLRVLEWAASKKEKVEVGPAMMERAIGFNHAKVLQWLHKQGLSITNEIVALAAESNKLEILKAIHAIDSSLVCTEKVFITAVKGFGRQRHDVAHWIWKTCQIRPTKDIPGKDFAEWLKWMSNDFN